MGSGKMGHCVIGKTTVDRKSTNDILPLKTNIPIFHHSIIPAQGKNPSLKKACTFNKL